MDCACRKQREKSEQIAKTMASVDEQQQRTEQLLYSMIPKPTAIRLKNGEDPINTWEVTAGQVSTSARFPADFGQSLGLPPVPDFPGCP